MVHVTFDLDQDEEAGGARYVSWKAGGMEGWTRKAAGSSVTCRIPKDLFQQGTLVKLEILPACDSTTPVLSWTHIPALGEASLWAHIVDGAPVLGPTEPDRQSSVRTPHLSRRVTRPDQAAVAG